jgi:hypothetical protein
MASLEAICLRRRQLRRRVDEDGSTRRFVHERRHNILRNFADEVMQDHLAATCSDTVGAWQSDSLFVWLVAGGWC